MLPNGFVLSNPAAHIQSPRYCAAAVMGFCVIKEVMMGLV